jgi:chaperonin GroES
MEMTGHVLPGKLLIKQDEALEKTAGGILIPQAFNEKPKKGTVVVVGGDTPRFPMVVEVGDTVLFAEHAGTTYKLEDEGLHLDGDYLLLDQTQVLFIKREK